LYHEKITDKIARKKKFNNCPKIIEEMIFVVRLAAVETVWKNGVISTKMSEDF
jgi:hypothetical protein